MKVHLVFAPPLISSRVTPIWEAALPPLGILYLASYLQKMVPGLELRATDGTLRGMAKTLDEVSAFGPDVLCVSFYTGSALGAYYLVDRVKQEQPEVVAVAGGPHATAVPDDVLGRSRIDVVVRGEGEQILVRLIQTLLQHGNLTTERLDDIGGIAYRREDGSMATTPVPSYVANLDELPFPAWHLLPMNEYRGYHLCKQTPEYPILFSRGCPHDCVFCPNEHWNLSKPKVRLRTPKNVVDEMAELAHTYGIREFNNLADELNNHPTIALGVCQEIKRRKLGVTWKTMLRADHVTEELVRAMAESGCWMASLGIETGNPATMVGIKKRFTHEQIESACRLFKKYGLKVQSYFMLFNVWEDNGDLRFEGIGLSANTVQYAERLFNMGLLDYMGWSVATPYPGSELYQIALRHELIKHELVEHWDDWNQKVLFIMRLPGVSEDDQIRVLSKAQMLGAKASFLRQGIRLADLPMMFKTAIHTLRTEVQLTLSREASTPAHS